MRVATTTAGGPVDALPQDLVDLEFSHIVWTNFSGRVNPFWRALPAREAPMSASEFRERFNDMKAGFVGWRRLSPDRFVVSCEVYDTSAHEGAWLAAAAESRAEASAVLKAFGVHGFKFDRRPYNQIPDGLVSAACDHLGSVVAMFPEGELEVFADPR